MITVQIAISLPLRITIQSSMMKINSVSIGMDMPVFHTVSVTLLKKKETLQPKQTHPGRRTKKQFYHKLLKSNSTPKGHLVCVFVLIKAQRN